MEEIFLRLKMLLGDDAFDKLRKSRVAVFGIGGVGGYSAEALVRSGIGEIDIIDKDIVDVTNINRQIIADTQTIGKDKTSVMEKRLRTISPDTIINPIKMFYLPENANEVDLSVYDYIIDAIDNITAKLELISRAKSANIPIISSMGTGNKLFPERFEISDIYKTSVCPLAKVMRTELKKRGISKDKFYKESGISSASMSQWRNNQYVPSPQKIRLIEEYLGVTFEIEKKEKPTTQKGGELSPIRQEVWNLLNSMSDEKLEKALVILRAAAEM